MSLQGLYKNFGPKRAVDNLDLEVRQGCMFGLVGPKDMPPDLVKKIADEAIRAASTEGAKSVVAQQGGDMVASTPAAFAEFILAERKRYETIVRDAGMTVE